MAANFARKVSRFFKKLGLVGYSKRRNIFGIHPLFISTFYIFLTLLLASLLRKIINLVFSNDNVFKQMLLEFVATLELCGACFELIIGKYPSLRHRANKKANILGLLQIKYRDNPNNILAEIIGNFADNWGIGAYALYLFLLTIWWSTTWNTASACPYSPIEEVFEGTKDVSTTALVIFAQLLGAIVTFRYVQILWAMELVETHRGKAFEDCVADLQVHFLIGTIIEAIGTCFCRLTSKILSDVEARFSNIFDAFIGTLMVVIAFNWSGGYFNPALATSLKLGCNGNTFVEHFVVYWLGATIGSILSVFIFRTSIIQDYIKSIKAKTE